MNRLTESDAYWLGEEFWTSAREPDDEEIDEVYMKLKEYEDAEEQGLLVRVECRCKDCVHWSDMVAGATEHVKLCTIGGYMVGKNGYCLYGEKKLKGEEHE